MLQIYGPSGGRTARAIWAAQEVGLAFERTEIDADGKAAFRAINPNARFPTIVDDGFILYESMAITLYLAKTYGAGALYPQATQDEARTLQWAFWGMTDLEPPLITCLRERVFKPETARDPAAATAAETQLQGSLAVLEAKLAGSAYLLGDDFTIADLNLAAILSFAGKAEVALGGFPHVLQWLATCRARPAAAAFGIAWPL